MRDIILQKLQEIERDNNVTILFAIESGSRGWGFHSTDSDYDVRFVYKHNEDWYLTIDEQRDVIELPVDEVLDINGWDIRKALKLAAKSNFVLWEWLQSPIIYKEVAGIREQMLTAIGGRFSPISVAHSYLSLAKRTMKEHYQVETILMKKYFYIIRPLFCALWIIEKGGVPPMIFAQTHCLVAGEVDFLSALDELLKVKAVSTEKDTCDRISAIDAVINKTLDRIESVVADLPKAPGGFEPLNEFFRQVVRS